MILKHSKALFCRTILRKCLQVECIHYVPIFVENLHSIALKVTENDDRYGIHADRGKLTDTPFWPFYGLRKTLSHSIWLNNNLIITRYDKLVNL